MKAYSFLFKTNAPEEIWGHSDQKLDDDSEQLVLINLYRIIVMQYFQTHKPKFLKKYLEIDNQSSDNNENLDDSIRIIGETTRGGLPDLKEPFESIVRTALKDSEIVLYGGPFLIKNPFDEYFLLHFKF